MSERMSLNEIAGDYDISRQTIWYFMKARLASGELVLEENCWLNGRRYEIDRATVRKLLGEPRLDRPRHTFGQPEVQHIHAPSAERKRRICAQNLRRRSAQLLYDLRYWQDWAGTLGEETHAETEPIAQAVRMLHEHMLRIEHGEEAAS